MALASLHNIALSCLYDVRGSSGRDSARETLTEEKQEKLIINKSNCELDTCGSVSCGLQPNRSRGIDNRNMLTNWKNLIC